jgi:hypothetical protein
MDTSQTIELCKALFYVFAGIGAASFLLSVFLFFKFDIPYTYSMLTGKAKKRTIEQMEKQKFQTGKLRMNYPTGNTGETTRKRGKTGNTKTGMTAQPGYTPAPAPVSYTPAPAPVQYGAAPAAPAAEYRAETQVLQVDAPETQLLQPDLGETEVLQPDLLETEVLHTDTLENQVLSQEENVTMILNKPQDGPCTEDLSKTTILKPEPENDFLFRITEETISINTNELI